MLNNKDLQALFELSDSGLRKHLSALHASELAELVLSCRKDEERLQLISAIPEKLLGDTLLELPEAIKDELLSKLNTSHIEEVVEHLDSDDAADILQSVTPEVADEVIKGL
ncbi:MAG TPA: magnesium transporter, partial [Ghiorsea sp.]|nr:magnesium transporter [Ghiorsea sp.]